MEDKRRETLAVSLLMLFLGIISTFPLITYFDSGIPWSFIDSALTRNKSGDHLQSYYWLWLLKDNFFGAADFNTNPYEFNMLTPQSTQGLNMIPFSFLYLLFSYFGDIAGYNCLIISSYILAGLFMYKLVRLYSGSVYGALLGAVIFTFAPMRLNGISGGQINGFLFFLFPFIVYFFEQCLRQKRLKYGIYAGIGLFSLSLLEPHLTYYLFVFLGAFIPFRLLMILAKMTADDRSLRQQSRGLEVTLDKIPAGVSLTVIMGAGVASVLCSYLVFVNYGTVCFFSFKFWTVIILYPLLLSLLSFCFAILYRLLFGDIPLRACLAIEAISFLPLLISPVLYKILGNANGVIITTFCLVCLLKVLLLSTYLKDFWQLVVHKVAFVKNELVALSPLFLGMGLTVGWMMYMKSSKFSSSIAGEGRTLKDVYLHSPRLEELVVSHSSIYIGFIPSIILIVFVCGLIWQFTFRNSTLKLDTQETALRLLFCFVTFFSFILALGMAFGCSSLYALFYHYFPFFNFPRVSDRMMIVVFFGLAIIAGYAVKSCQRKWSFSAGKSVSVALFLPLILLQLYNYSVFKPLGITLLDKGQDVYKYAKAHMGDGLLLELPLWPGDSHQSSLYEYNITVDQIKRVNGYSPIVTQQYIDSIYHPLSSLNMGSLDAEQYTLLKKLNVEYITVHNNPDIFPAKVSFYPPVTTIRKFKDSPYLEYIPLNNHIYFKTYKEKNRRLFLFKVKDTPGKVSSEIDYTTEKFYIPRIYDTSSRLYQQTGGIVFDKSLQRKVFRASPRTDGKGFLVYGPYDGYEKGDYHLYARIFSGLAASPEDPTADFSVAIFRDKKQTLVTQKSLYSPAADSSYREIELDFSLARRDELEFKLFFHKNAEVRLDAIVVAPVSEVAEKARFEKIEAEALVGDIGDVVYDPLCSNGKCVGAIPSKDKGLELLLYGPYWKYEKGNYRVLYGLKVQQDITNKKQKQLGRIYVSSRNKTEHLAGAKIFNTDLDSSEIKVFEIPFSLPQAEELSFNVQFVGGGYLQVDWVKIEKIDGE